MDILEPLQDISIVTISQVAPLARSIHVKSINFDSIKLIHDLKCFIIVVFDSYIFRLAQKLGINIKLIYRIIEVVNSLIKAFDLGAIEPRHILNLTSMHTYLRLAFTGFSFEVFLHVL